MEEAKIQVKVSETFGTVHPTLTQDVVQIVQEGNSDIVPLTSLNAQTAQTGVVSLSEEDSTTLASMATNGTNTVVCVDGVGNHSVRFYNSVGRLIIIVFLSANGPEDTYLVGYQYSVSSGTMRCIMRQVVPSRVLTPDNWQAFITVPSPWQECTDWSDANLANATELYIQYPYNGYTWTQYICVPDTLLAHTWEKFKIAYENGEYIYVYYNGSQLNVNLLFPETHLFWR